MRFFKNYEILLFATKEILRLTSMVADSKLKPSQSPYVKKCICYINENLGEKITVANLSQYCGVSSDYLSQTFKKEIGENLSSYIIRKKLEAAKIMLADGKTSVDICEILGFSSQSHFITSFKKYYHMTPTEYTKMAK